MKKFACLLAAAAAAVGITLAALPASANTGTAIGTTDGDAGYIATGLGVIYHQGQATFTITNAMNAIGISPSLANPSGAVGIGGCHSGTGQAAEVGVVKLASGFTVADQVGTLKNNGADRCVDNGILTGGTVVHPLLSGLPVGTSLTVEWYEFAHGVVFFVSNNITGQAFSNFVSFGTHRVCYRHPGYWYRIGHHWVWHRGWNVCRQVPNARQFYNESLYGVMADPTLLGGGTPGDLVDFSGVQANLGNPDTATTFVRPVYSSADATTPWLIGPDNDPAGAAAPFSPPVFNCATQSQPNPSLVLPLTPGNAAFSVCADTAVGA